MKFCLVIFFKFFLIFVFLLCCYLKLDDGFFKYIYVRGVFYFIDVVIIRGYYGYIIIKVSVGILCDM